MADFSTYIPTTSPPDPEYPEKWEGAMLELDYRFGTAAVFDGTLSVAGAASLNDGGALVGTFSGDPILSGNPAVGGNLITTGYVHSKANIYVGNAGVGNLITSQGTWALNLGYNGTTVVAIGNGSVTVTGTHKVSGAFGCNGATEQTAYVSGGALASYGAGANGFDSGANASALHAMVVKLRAALVAAGIMS